ncbi:MAG: glycosyltransferase family 9 protein [Fibrobacterota bacterium]|nr:glycosyltransferase family 9 protein [Fibrobacterota bacterium]
MGSRLARPRPVEIDLSGCRKVLVLEMWGLGDVVFAAPAIKALMSHGAGCTVDLLVQPSSKPLLDLLGLGVKPVFFKFPWTRFTNKYNPADYLRPSLWKLIRKLRAERYDLVLSVREDPRDAFLARLISPRHSLGYAAFGSGLFLSSSIKAGKSHKTEAWFHLLAFLGVLEAPAQAFGKLRTEIRARLPAVAPEEGKRIILHCSARNPVRNWGVERFVELGGLLEKEGYRILWLSDSNSSSSAAVPERWERMAGGLAEILAIIASCDLYIGNDGGLMHMADLVGARICAVFGPTDPSLFFPYGQPHSIVFLPVVACRPCFDYCIYSRPICFDGITALDVRAKVLKILSAPAAQSPTAK